MNTSHTGDRVAVCLRKLKPQTNYSWVFKVCFHFLNTDLWQKVKPHILNIYEIYTGTIMSYYDKNMKYPLFCVWSFANCMWLFTNIFKHKIRFFRKQTYHPYGYFFLTAVSWSIMKCGHGVLSNQIVSLCVLISMHYLMVLSRSRSITERKKNKWSFHIFAKTFLELPFWMAGKFIQKCVSIPDGGWFILTFCHIKLSVFSSVELYQWTFMYDLLNRSRNFGQISISTWDMIKHLIVINYFTYTLSTLIQGSNVFNFC